MSEGLGGQVNEWSGDRVTGWTADRRKTLTNCQTDIVRLCRSLWHVLSASKLSHDAVLLLKAVCRRQHHVVVDDGARAHGKVHLGQEHLLQWNITNSSGSASDRGNFVWLLE